MASLFSNEVMNIKKIFPHTIYCLRSISTMSSYKEIIYVINTFFEINKNYFEILTTEERITCPHYCEKEKMLVETTISVKCKPVVTEPLDNTFIQYCGEYQNSESKTKMFNQYKENYYKTIEKDDLDRNALEFHIYIREFSYIKDDGETITEYFVDFNYITKIRTKLFEITYRKLREIFDILKTTTVELLNNTEQYQINYEGELFEEERIHCLAPFMRALPFMPSDI